jgi:hypothetical protein
MRHKYIDKSPGMTLKEAIEKAQGRKVRRQAWRLGKNLYTSDLDDTEVSLEDAVADDWEFEQKQTFTRTDVQAAIKEAHRLTALGYKQIEVEIQSMVVAEQIDLGEKCEGDL